MVNSNTYMRYLRLGLSLRPIRGKAKTEQEHAYAIEIEGVQYVLNDGGVYEESNDSSYMVEILKNLEAIVNSHRHDKVAFVQDYLESTLQKKVWCEVSYDSQLGILYGTEDGEICQLAMDFRSPEKFEEYRKEIYDQLLRMGVEEDRLPDIDPMKTFILMPEENIRPEIFDKFKCPGIIIDFADDDE